MTKDEALKLAQEALERGETELRWKAITAIREALAQPEYTSEADTEELLKLNELPEPLRLAAMLEKTMQWPLHAKAADCLRKMHAALEQPAQPEQEPFGYFRYDLRLDAWVQNREGRPGTPFYTTPPQRKPLTDEEIADLWSAQIFHINDLKLAKDFVRDIEAAHGIKE